MLVGSDFVQAFPLPLVLAVLCQDGLLFLDQLHRADRLRGHVRIIGLLRSILGLSVSCAACDGPLVKEFLFFPVQLIQLGTDPDDLQERVRFFFPRSLHELGKI